MRYSFFITILISLLLSVPALAQDSLNVTFRYFPNDNAVRSFVPGSFNNWGNNSNGQISPSDGSLLTIDSENGFSYQVIRLREGGGSVFLNGQAGYAYKFHEQYSTGEPPWAWFTDPLNRKVVGANSDSWVRIEHPMVFQMQPAQNSVHQDAPPAIWANIAARDSDPIDVVASQIIVNGTLAATFEDWYLTDRQLLHVPSFNDLGLSLNIGSNVLKIVAVTGNGITRSDSTAFTYIAVPDVVAEARPPGLEDGITLYEDEPGKVSFSLFAPGKEYVYVIGDHSNWEVKSEFLMKMDAPRSDSVHFWLTLDDLDAGTYRFQYLIDGELRMPDLFSEMILDQQFDQYISSSVYPDMPEYPFGKTTDVVSVFEMGAQSYAWEVPDFERPPQHTLVVYELLLRDFVDNSTFTVLRDTLDYLQRLGVNAIELMPVSNFDGNLSWGYNPNFHGALDKSYGTPNAFKAFVDEAHKRGMAVILDVVYNHAQDKSPLIRLYGTNPANNPFLGPGHNYNVFFHLNHDNAYIKYWLDRMNRYWMETYNIDGYRFDLSKGFASNVNSASLLDGYNAQRIANLKRMADAIWEFDPRAYIILEHFAADNEEQELAHYRSNDGDIKGMMLWRNMNHAFSQSTMGYTSGSNFAGGFFKTRGWAVPNTVTYMESHDEQWLMLKNIKFGNSSGDYSVKTLDVALERMKMAGTFFFTQPGPKMLWQFGELGYGGGPQECLKPGDGSNGDCLPADPGRTASKPVRWEYRSDPDRYRVYQTWSELLRLRRENPLFHSPETTINFAVAGDFKYMRLTHPTMDAVVIGNFGVTSITTNVSFTKTGTWFNFFLGGTYAVTQTSMSITLEPGEFRIYTSEWVQPAVPGLLTSIGEDFGQSELPSDVALYQNYPNPFNPSTRIDFDLPSTSDVRLIVYDILGREIAVLADETFTAGRYSRVFDASGLSSGTYLIRLQTADKVLVKKMTLVK